VSLNAQLVGKTYPPIAFLLEAERVTLFASVIGHEGDGVPPTFATAPELAAGLRNVLADDELGLDLSRVLHAEQEYEWARPLTIGETLTAETTIADIRTKGAMSFVVLRTDLRDEARRPVVVATSTLLVRGDA
jgi:N-terminal half of MaoC dehydratase